jgi:threonine/homoserine/homoserine lactone efflux protein
MHFLYGLLGSYIGGVMFGPINLSVVEVTLKHNLKSGLRFAAAAALVEIAQAGVAVFFGKFIGQQLAQHPSLQWLIVVFFAGLGMYFILKRQAPPVHKVSTKSPSNTSHFVNGGIIAAINPQAIPYWIFVLAFLNSSNVLAFDTLNLFIFLAGVSIGKFIILSTFGFFSERIGRRIKHLDEYVSKGVGILLLAIGVIQMFRILLL